MTYLNIPFDRFQAAYDNYLFIPATSAMGDKVVLEYLSWSAATKLLNQFFPELVVEFEKDENNSYVFKIDNNLAQEVKQVYIAGLDEKKKQLEVADWKEKKNITKELEEISYDNRGFYVLPYLVHKETGERTPSLLFPVMNNTNDPIYNPHVRDINDSKARGGVKAISLYTGLGLRLFTREDIDINGKKGLVKDSPKWKRIKSIIESCQFLERVIDMSVVHLGRTEDQLEKIAIDLYIESVPMREEAAKRAKK